jgi:Mn2+/Fe2+ NRAMP family transporter
LVAAAAGNDAGGLATYAAAGARYGYDLLWVLVLTTVSLAVVQEMCARLGAASGRGLLDLIRERFGLGWALFAVGVILLANGGLVVSEFVGIGAAAELLGLSKYLAVPLSTALLWALVTFGSYSWVEHMFLGMTLGFFAYPVAAWLAHPSWAAVARGGLLPTGHADPEYLFLLVGVLGTTITPYMQLFQQSAIVERGAARRHYGPERVDAYVGAIFSNGMSLCVMIATAATLHVSGHTTLETAADVAQALRPVAGPFAETLFAIGLLGAGLLSGAVLPLATAYTVSEAFGTPKGVDLDFRRARVFFTIFTALLLLGAGAALVPQIPVMPVLVWAQVLNGMLLPITLVFLLRLVNDPRMTGDLHNTRVYNMLGWGTVVLVTVAVVVLLGSPLLTGLGR